ncbi:MAG: ribonuclease P protein component [Cyanobacteria bacterium P01_A01_bin.84]
MALPKKHRLKSRRDFQAVFRRGLRRHGSYMTLRALRPTISGLNVGGLNSFTKSSLPNHEQRQHIGDIPLIVPIRLGISVSTKVSKRAVVRNRLKRQISAAFYQLLPLLSPGWRLVVIIKPTAVECECASQQFLQELKQLLAQIEVLKLNGHS